MWLLPMLWTETFLTSCLIHYPHFSSRNVDIFTIFIPIRNHLTFTVYSSASTRYMWSSMGQSISFKPQVPSVTDPSSLFLYACFLIVSTVVTSCLTSLQCRAYSMSVSVCMGQSVCFSSFRLLWALFSVGATRITGPEHVSVISPLSCLNLVS